MLMREEDWESELHVEAVLMCGCWIIEEVQYFLEYCYRR